ncbi:polyprenyl synthetase family protein [Xylophilus sp. GOD-11R]|uniref:polyprenyl synthetase family protein n=1 Tax=Xylophilus sp. GOD-11R TaxID=3089814 RepID=UPI00298C023A|nr:polyprenyl synthetase family protein [Xylophilus sp. GOD-11R]WPB55825.1 polyprenyl synthetase family protein [Xylophilus sp. GOD-11R]
MRLAIDHRLATLLQDCPNSGNRVSAAMRYGALAPGKRIRPVMLLLTARSLGLDSSQLLDAACALEMVHAASLFLDDLPCMDDAVLRRGQPTVHVAFGEDVALLGTIALLSCAVRTTATLPGIDAAIRADMVVALSNAVGLQGLVTGQYRDLHDSQEPISPLAAEAINDQKTGALFAAAFELAAIAAGASPRVRGHLREAATALGRAFQLADDLLDVESSALETGKDSGQDAGKSTLVAQLGPARARRQLAAHVQEAQRQIALALPADTALAELTRCMFAGALVSAST